MSKNKNKLSAKDSLKESMKESLENSKNTKKIVKKNDKENINDDITEDDIFEMKDYITRRSNLLKLESRQDILSFLMQNIDDDHLIESNDGTRINLDNVNDKTIKDIYIKIKHKIENNI